MKSKLKLTILLGVVLSATTMLVKAKDIILDVKVEAYKNVETQDREEFIYSLEKELYADRLDKISENIIIADIEKKKEEERIALEKKKEDERIQLQLESINKVNPEDITILSNLTPEQFNIVVEHTWLSGYGQDLYDLEKKYNINGLFAASVSIHEVGRDITNSNKAMKHNNIFGIMVGKTIFNSYADCMAHFGSFINRLYVDEGLISIQTVSKKYCVPGSEHWEDNIKNIIEEFNIVIDDKIM